jgi:hypothetical protein
VKYLREKLLPVTNHWQHLAVGLLGSFGIPGKLHTFERFWNEPLRYNGVYFQICPECRDGARTVQQFIDKEEEHERYRQEAPGHPRHLGVAGGGLICPA